MESRIEFFLIGQEEAEDEAFDLSSLPAATVSAPHQALYWEGEEKFALGERAGDLDGSIVVGRRGRAVCQLVLTLDEDNSLVAVGVLPAEQSWDGTRTIAIVGGTGTYERATGSVTVETRNPKRYGVSAQIGG